MPVRAKAPPYDDIARRWRDLAERRRAYFVDLYESGRWQRYYSEAKFLSEMREAVKAADDWAKIAPHDEPVTEPSE
jgi:uncharacterized repeat protein (TIGR03809 family)